MFATTIPQISRKTCRSICGRNYQDALSQLNTLQKGVYSFSDNNRPKLTPRERTLAWLEYLKLDINKTRYIHVAGTKGKGTTCLYTEHLIHTYHLAKQSKVKIGCLTSPHVTSVRERIRIDLAPVSEQCFTTHFWSLWDHMQPATSATPVATVPPMPGYPAFITLLAFYIFNVEKVDLAILETGMGGETDSTNVVVAPVATGISELGLDHVNRLGNSIESIAWHKSGIFKAGVPAFSVAQLETATEVLKKRAGEKGTKVEFVDKRSLIDSAIKVVPDVTFQRSNASLALALAGAYAKQTIPPGDITPSIAQCLEHTELPAKFEVISQGKVSWVLSSAHNEMSINAACQTFLTYLQENSERPTALVFCHDSHRDSEKLLSSIYSQICLHGKRPFHCAIICSDVLEEPSDDHRDLLDLRHSSKELEESRQRHASIWTRFSDGGSVTTVSTVRGTVDHIYEMDMDMVVFVVGSSYLAGMARHVLSSR